jgi:phosphoglycolate phosphatase-like HAD superfamily hydrolase
MALAAFYAIPLAEREKRVAQVLQIKDEHLVRLVGANPARHPLRPVPGARALVRALARAGVSLGIVSGNTAIAALLKLQRGGFRPVDFCVVSSGGRLADRADIVAVALNAIRAKLPDLRPAEILVVGDTLADIAAGRRHGTHTLAVVSDRMSAAALAAGGPDLLVEAFPPLRVLLESLFGAENEGRSETEHPAASPRPS